LLPNPFQLARSRVQRDYRVGVQIVALAFVPEVIRRGVAYTPVQGVCLLVISAGQPAATSAGIAGVAGPAVGVILDGVEFPLRLAGVGIDRIDLAALRGIARRRRDDEHVTS